MPKTEFPYETLVLRNQGYVSPEIQKRLGEMRVLVAGCGMGSALAESLVRLGIRRLRLVDGDVVDGHNLNRQIYVAADIGRPKVEGLRNRLMAINPSAEIEAINDMVTPGNAGDLVRDCDLILDTIDFLSLSGIVAIHDAARAQGRPVISALSIGFGGGVTYLPPDGACTFRNLFGLPDEGPVDAYSYIACFSTMVKRVAAHLDPQVAQVMATALERMSDGRPCPAPQVVAGTFGMAALTCTVIVRLLNGEPVPPAPQLILLSLGTVVGSNGISLMEGCG